MLEERLKPLANKLKAAIAKGEAEANSRGMFYSGQAVLLKTEYWLETISELLEIHKKYSSKQNLEQINQFIDGEKDKLAQTFSKHGLRGEYDKLEESTQDLKILLQGQSSSEENMDDLTSKTDEELRDIMRASINNSYVPSSIYHKAKQELDFRAADSKSPTSTQNFHGPVGVVGQNSGEVNVAPEREKNVRKPWDNPLFQTILGIVGTIGVAYLVYKLGWN